MTAAENIAHWMFFEGSKDPGDGIIAWDWDDIEEKFDVKMTLELAGEIQAELYAHPLVLDSDCGAPGYNKEQPDRAFIDCNFSTWLCSKEQEEYAKLRYADY